MRNISSHRSRAVTNAPQKLQRLRITFSRGTEAKYCSHLDLMRLWERALRRASLPIAYSEGFSPHPRIALAAPLPVGVTGSAEIMEVYLRKRVSPHFFIEEIRPQLPAGLDISQIEETDVALPSVQSLVRQAEYHVEIESAMDPGEIESRIERLLAEKRLPIERSRPGGAKLLDLRALVDRIWVERVGSGRFVLGMALRTDPRGAGRPEEVATALGLAAPLFMHRVRLVLESSAT